MTPKEKAKELIYFYTKELLSAKYSINGFVIEQLAKQCALIAVDVVLAQLVDDGLYIGGETNINEYIEYWEEVKKEIEKL